ncbi:hypothetical protein ILUMI_12829 [Ignelater luminosus]|uniref:Uncharacterized protein n=1 Tax=Ignelater luminosus TaxID=2038154 RepID=A0A8K0CYV2_IGNLU|nr:hypothetical protein ILUMI_12829 [Ignelater luminosus]
MFAKLYVALTICINGFGFIFAGWEEDYEHLEKTIDVLNRTFDFILKDYKSMNVDGVLGVNTAQAHLIKAIKHAFGSDRQYDYESLKQKAEKIYLLQRPNLRKSPYKYHVFNNYVIPPEVLVHDINFSWGQLNLNPKVFIGPYNVSDLLDYARYVLKTTFDEETSDNCLVEVATASDDRKPHKCPVSKTCYDYMIKMPEIYDSHFPAYGVTHMTLYQQIARSRNCTFNKKQIDHLIKQQCSYILWELKKNVEFGYIPQLFDLFLEQIALCGQEGFEEFLLDEYLEYILQEQNECGGFGNKHVSWKELAEKQRIKRESNPMMCGANSHTTGLATAALALFIRLLELKVGFIPRIK